MTIIAVVNTKGGVGKSTTAVHLAAGLAKIGSTLLIDTDSQRTASSWAMWRKEANREPSPTCAMLYDQAVRDDGKVLAQNFANTVVDAGGRDSKSLRAALLLAQVAIVPVGASNFDAAGMTDLEEILDMSRQYNPDLKIRVLLTRLSPNPRSLDTQEMATYLVEKGFAVLNTRVHERVAWRRSVGQGATVEEFGDDDAAKAEFLSLIQEVVSV